MEGAIIALTACAALAIGGFWISLSVALWVLHIGADRALGYGLKGAHFKEMHLGHLGGGR